MTYRVANITDHPSEPRRYTKHEWFHTSKETAMAHITREVSNDENNRAITEWHWVLDFKSSDGQWRRIAEYKN
jgi:hypothetical protein